MRDSITIKENQFQVWWEIRTANVPNGTTLYWTLGLANGGSPGVTLADFGFAQDWGTVVINDNFASFPMRAVEDQAYEGPEYFVLQLRTNSQYGPVVAISNSVKIVDTSIGAPASPPYYAPPPAVPPAPPAAPPAAAAVPVYSLLASTLVIEEGNSITYTLTGQNIVNGTYYWYVNHTDTSALNFVAENGSFTVTNNSGNFVVDSVVNQMLSNGNRAFTVSIYKETTSTVSFYGLYTYYSRVILVTSDICYLTDVGGVVSGGGGGGSVAVNAYMPRTTKRAAEIDVGDPLVLLSFDRQGMMPGITLSNRISQQNLLTLISESGIRLTVSDNTPLTLPNGAYVNSTQALGNYLPVKDSDGFRWERIVEVVDAGKGLVATISCENQCYAAGDEPDKFIWTHNFAAVNKI